MMRLLFATLAMAGLLFVAAPQSASAQAQPAAPKAPTPPRGFQLTKQQEAYLDQVLTKWEAESAKITTFSCPFRRHVYNTFSPVPTIAFSIEEGKVSYHKPDKGSFQIEQIKQWKAAPVPPGQPAPNPPKGEHVLVDPEVVVGDHWVSDGQYVYEYRPHAKQLAVTPIPPDMQGEKIANGPFPFLFGAKKDDLKRRYWLQIHPNPDQNVIHLVALPKTRMDAMNYRVVELMLDRRTLLPSAMQVHDHNGGREVFQFHLDKVAVNARLDRLWGTLFQSPRTPWGWDRVVNGPEGRPVGEGQPPQRAAAPSYPRR